MSPSHECNIYFIIPTVMFITQSVKHNDRAGTAENPMDMNLCASFPRGRHFLECHPLVIFFHEFIQSECGTHKKNNMTDKRTVRASFPRGRHFSECHPLHCFLYSRGVRHSFLSNDASANQNAGHILEVF